MISVSIIEDEPVPRLGFVQVVANAPTLMLGIAVASVEEFRTASAGPSCDVVILDLHLRGGGLDGAPAVRQLCADGFAVLIVSAFDEEVPVLDAMAAGAFGYLTKEAEPDEIARAVTAVADRRTYLSATVAGFLLKQRSHLTDREIEVLRLVASGETAAEAAAKLHIAPRTVNRHLEEIRQKTGARNRADMTRLAYEKGILRRWRNKR